MRRISASPVVEQADYFPGGWVNNVIGGRTWGVPWYADTRLLFYRQDLLREAGFAKPPQTWAEWVAAMRAIKARGAPRDYAIFLPVNEYEPLLALALQQPEPLLRDDGRYGNFRSPGFVRASDFYLSLFREGWRRRSATRRSPTSTTSSPAAISPSTSAARGTSASSSAGCRPSGRTTG